MDGVPVAQRDILPIGVDVGCSVTKLVQLGRVRDQTELLAYARIPIPENLRADQHEYLAFLRKNIPHVLKTHPFKGKKCIFSLPAAKTFVRAMKIPRLDSKATELAVRRTVQMELPYPIDEAVVRHIVAGEVYDNGEMLQEVIVIAMPLDILNAHLDAFGRMGLEIVGVSIESVALVKCFAGLLSNSASQIAFIDMGSTSTQVTISHGANIVFSRNILHGIDQVAQTAVEGQTTLSEEHQSPEPHPLSAQNPEIDGADSALRPNTGGLPEGALLRASVGTGTPAKSWVNTICGEIGQCMRYHESTFRISKIERMIFTGGQAKDRQLCQEIAHSLNVPAQIGDPLAAMRPGNTPDASSGEARSTTDPDLAVSVGLSLIGEEM